VAILSLRLDCCEGSAGPMAAMSIRHSGRILALMSHRDRPEVGIANTYCCGQRQKNNKKPRLTEQTGFLSQD
jgi:hypothetical protein